MLEESHREQGDPQTKATFQLVFIFFVGNFSEFTYFSFPVDMINSLIANIHT